jgi:HAD superfamily hydrolase (TIGR01549 family)
LKIKAISFDYWHTLFAEQEGGYRLYQKTRRRLLKEALNEASDSAVTDEQLREAALAEARLHDRVWREEHRTLPVRERLGRILVHLNSRLSDEALTRIVSAYEEGILERPPVLIDGVREALERLAKDYRLGIISDVGFSPGRILKQVLHDEGILDVFDSLVFSDEAGCSKPHIEVFTRTAQALGARPEEIVHIGDLEHTDIVGAKGANYYAIRFTGVTPMSDGETTRADFVTADFSQIPNLIEAIGEQA